MTFFKAYQMVGGTEAWTSCYAEEDLSNLRPTFVTALSCDTLIDKQTGQDALEAAKYQGPFYMDLDSSDLEEAIEASKELWGKLKDKGLTSSDVEIYLSGKKGLHFIVPQTVFMEKPGALPKLPAIYKEMAFALAVETLDFSVYSARRGRMFRTVYNVRENGNYKVQITTQELENLDELEYGRLCRSPRGLSPASGTFRSGFGMIFETAKQHTKQKVSRRAKPVDAATLRKHLPTIQQVMRGEGLKEEAGFNKIAIQLATYAHEAKLTEDELVEQCSGLVANHRSDSHRYNSVQKREQELRRMYSYMEDNGGYVYSLGGFRSLLREEAATADAPQTPPAETDETGGIYKLNNNYYVASEQGDKHIMDAVFTDGVVLRNPLTEEISLLSAKIVTAGAQHTGMTSIERDTFASSTALHKLVAIKGASFTGSDIHARYIYAHMLKEIEQGGNITYATTTEGMDLLQMPMSKIVDAREPFLVWTDSSGVRLPRHLSEQGLQVRFAPEPGPEGLMKSDIALTPSFGRWGADEANRESLYKMVVGLLGCQEASSISKAVGWITACYYTQLFRRAYNQFPLFHIAGPAGTGKTQLMLKLMRLFYYNAEPVMQTASSSTFSISSYLASSASIPLVLDEYKPQEMGPQKVSDLKSLFRSSYNGQSISRGGGNRNTASFKGISNIQLSGPLSFIAEAVETESAITHRAVVVALRRLPGQYVSRTTPMWHQFCNNESALPIVGQNIAATILRDMSVDVLRKEFGPILQKTMDRFMLKPTDTIDSMPIEEYVLRSNINERTLFNYSVVEYGLGKFRDAVLRMLPEKSEELEPMFAAVMDAVYVGINKTVENSMAEFAKVLIQMSDMSRFQPTEVGKLTHGLEFEYMKFNNADCIALVGRICYNKYRAYCRSISVQPLYSNESSFVQSLKDSPVFAVTGSGTKGIRQETVLLDTHACSRMGIPLFTR